MSKDDRDDNATAPLGGVTQRGLDRESDFSVATRGSAERHFGLWRRDERWTLPVRVAFTELRFCTYVGVFHAGECARFSSVFVMLHAEHASRARVTKNVAAKPLHATKARMLGVVLAAITQQRLYRARCSQEASSARAGRSAARKPRHVFTKDLRALA